MSDVIQSLSICCPAKKCINHCETCTSRQHTNPYLNKYNGDHTETLEYWDNVIKRMRYAQSKGCTTVMLTGSNEPQQDRRWLEALWLAMRSLPEPFTNIEIQTTGAFIDDDYLQFFKSIGVTTVAVSTFNIFSDKVNRLIEHCPDDNLCIEDLCSMVKSHGLNLRICVNVTDYALEGAFLQHRTLETREAQVILTRCATLDADQVTFRKMWSVEGTPEGDWIKEHCTDLSTTILHQVKEDVKKDGQLIYRLPYGAERYDYMGFSIVIDTDSMAKEGILKDTSEVVLKYYIIREDGKMYSSWDSKASLVF